KWGCADFGCFFAVRRCAIRTGRLRKPAQGMAKTSSPTLEHPLVGADQVPRRLAEDGAPAILHSAPEVLVTPCPAPRRIVRRADDVREVEKRVTHREAAMPHRLHPPRVDAGEKVRMGNKMCVERSLIDD